MKMKNLTSLVFLISFFLATSFNTGCMKEEDTRKAIRGEIGTAMTVAMSNSSKLALQLDLQNKRADEYRLQLLKEGYYETRCVKRLDLKLTKPEAVE